MDIAYLITTYNRPKSLRKLVHQLKGLGDIYIVDDGTPGAKKIKETEYRINEHRGKPGYYKTVTDLWQMPKKDYDYYFMIPDDFLPVELFIHKALKTWLQIDDLDKICLNLFTEKSRYMKPCWTNFQPVDLGYVIKSQWVDMCFIAERDFFEHFEWGCPGVFRDWTQCPELGSGVGSVVSKSLHNAGKSMYQVKHSLFKVQPEGFTSQMNIGNNGLIYETID